MSWRDIYHQYLALILIFFSCIGFSIQSLFVKILREQGFAVSIESIFIRGIFLLLISLFSAVRMSKLIDNGDIRKVFGKSRFETTILISRSFLGFFGNFFTFLAVEKLPLGDATVLVMLSPLFASIGGYFILGEKWYVPEFIAMIISIIGAILVAKPAFIFNQEVFNQELNSSSNEVSLNTIGIVYAILAAMFTGAVYILIRILGTSAKMPWSYVCFSQAIGQSFLSIPSQYVFHEPLSVRMSWDGIILLLMGSLIGSWSQIAMTVGMQRERSAPACAVRMSDVIFGFVWQVLFTSDPYNWLSIIGALLVMLSIAIIIIFRERSGFEQTSGSNRLFLHDIPNNHFLSRELSNSPRSVAGPTSFELVARSKVSSLGVDSFSLNDSVDELETLL